MWFPEATIWNFAAFPLRALCAQVFLDPQKGAFFFIFLKRLLPQGVTYEELSYGFYLNMSTVPKPGSNVWSILNLRVEQVPKRAEIAYEVHPVGDCFVPLWVLSGVGGYRGCLPSHHNFTALLIISDHCY